MRFIIIDHCSGYIFGDTADYVAPAHRSALTPRFACQLLDESNGSFRSYTSHGAAYKPASNEGAYFVYRADVRGSEQVPVVHDGQDQEMIDAVERDCELVDVVTYGEQDRVQIHDLRDHHAALVEEMKHWEHEQTILSGEDKVFAERQYRVALKRAQEFAELIAKVDAEERA
jgi:hypothetical protein